MTPQLILVLVSTVAALLVAATGYLWGRRSAAQEARGSTDTLQDQLDQFRARAEGADQRVRELQSHLCEAEAELQTHTYPKEQAHGSSVVQYAAEVSLLQDQLATARQREKDRAAELAAERTKHEAEFGVRRDELAQSQRLRARVSDAEKKLATACEQLGRLPTVAEHRSNIQQIAEQTRRLEELAEEIEDLKALEPLVQERQALALELEVSQRRVEDLSSAEHHLIEFKGRVCELEARLEEAQICNTELRSERQELVARVETLTGQSESLDRIREENTVLRGQAGEVEALGERIVQLQAVVKDARAKGLVASRPPLSAAPDPEPRIKGLGSSLQHTLEHMARVRAMRSAVVADQQGFLVAGVGDHSTELAAIAPLIRELWTRTSNLLLLPRFQKIELVYDDALTVTARPLPKNDFLLATLSIGAAPTGREVDRVLGARTLAPAQQAD